MTRTMFKRRFTLYKESAVKREKVLVREIDKLSFSDMAYGLVDIYQELLNDHTYDTMILEGDNITARVYIEYLHLDMIIEVGDETIELVPIYNEKGLHTFLPGELEFIKKPDYLVKGWAPCIDKRTGGRDLIHHR